MIIGEVRRYLRDNNSVRVSRSVRDLAYRALGAREQLVRTLDREPTLEGIALREAMKKLSPREKNIIDMRYFKGRTQMEIASEIGISQAQMSRIEKAALERIKKDMQKKGRLNRPFSLSVIHQS